MCSPEGWLVFELITPYALERPNNTLTRHLMPRRFHGVIHVHALFADTHGHFTWQQPRALMLICRRKLEEGVPFVEATGSGLAPRAGAEVSPAKSFMVPRGWKCY